MFDKYAIPIEENRGSVLMGSKKYTLLTQAKFPQNRLCSQSLASKRTQGTLKHIYMPVEGAKVVFVVRSARSADLG